MGGVVKKGLLMVSHLLCGLDYEFVIWLCGWCGFGLKQFIPMDGTVLSSWVE
jgi:hypothetical protein